LITRLFLGLLMGVVATGCRGADGSGSQTRSVGADEFDAAISFWRTDIGDCELAARIGSDFTSSGSVAPDPFPFGSVTKSFTAVLVLKLAELGKLSLDDKLAKFGFNIRGDGSITIRDLLTQASGLPEYFYSVEPAKPPASGQILSMIRTAAAGSSLPRGSFHYANTNYYLLGAICSQVTGDSLGDLLKRYVCVPIGISAHPETLPSFDLNWYGGAGNLAGSIGDLAAFGEAVAKRDERLLSSDGWGLLKSPHVSMDDSGQDQYGYGLIVARMSVYAVVTHAGEIPANGGEPPFVSILIAREGGTTPVSFAAFGRTSWNPKSLNALYGAFDSVCAMADVKVWITRLCAGLPATSIQEYVKAGAIAPDLATLMSPETLGALRDKLGTLKSFLVTGEMVRRDSVSLEGYAHGSAGDLHVTARFGDGGRLDSIAFK
jgi:hypothetical protein